MKQGNTIQTQHNTWQGIVMLALVINVHRTLLLFQELVWIAESACESVLIFIYILITLLLALLVEKII